MTSIFPSGNAFKASNITNKQQSESAEIMEKISHGKRLVSGADDAGNIFNVNNLKAKVLSTKASIRNVTDIMSMAQLAEQGYKNINNMLLRANELALQSTNKIYKDTDRIAINNEIQNTNEDALFRTFVIIYSGFQASGEETKHTFHHRLNRKSVV